MTRTQALVIQIATAEKDQCWDLDAARMLARPQITHVASLIAFVPVNAARSSPLLSIGSSFRLLAASQPLSFPRVHRHDHSVQPD